MRFGWTGLGSWTHPLVALRLYDTGIELGPAGRWLSGLVPVWRSRLDELAVVEPVGQASPDPVQPWPNLEWTRGVRFITNDRSCAIFGATDVTKFWKGLLNQGCTWRTGQLAFGSSTLLEASHATGSVRSRSWSRSFSVPTALCTVTEPALHWREGAPKPPLSSRTGQPVGGGPSRRSRYTGVPKPDGLAVHRYTSC